MKFIELFAGIGGFRLGLERAGHKCVWSNEIQPKARSIYEKNFGESPDGRDIRTIRHDEIPDTELLVGGFPCATFSTAGKRTGFSTEDTRGTLFFEICRIAGAKRIPYLFLENVKGLLNHDNGRTFAVILSSLDELGYDVQWQCVNSKNFGVPQHRERLFIIASIRGIPRPKVFPIGQGSPRSNESRVLDKKQARTLTGRMRKGIGNTESRIVGVLINQEKGERLDTLEEICDIFLKEDEKLVMPILTPDRPTKRQNGPRYKNNNEPSFTLTAQDRHGVFVAQRKKSCIRKLTPLECERLQGLPDNYTKYYHDGKIVLDAERYERCGRAVTIPVIEAIGKRLPL
jgi:DNA (cytosine-5)-methyltransferase 1